MESNVRHGGNASETPLLSPESRLKIARSEGIIAIFGNALLGSFKFWVGITTGSLAVIADSWETLSDCISSLVLVIGLKIAAKPADEEHPFGHGRAELICSVVIAMMLAGIGVSFAKGGVEKIIARESAEFGGLAIFAMIATIIVKEAMAQYAFWAARKTKLLSLCADAWHHRSDTLSSAILLAGMLATRCFGNALWWMDGALSVVVGLLLLRLAWSVLRDSANRLLGMRVPAEIETRIREIASRVGGRDDFDLHHLHFHEYGTHSELTFHIRFDGETPLREAHACADAIEKAISGELGIEATIHLEAKKQRVSEAGTPVCDRSRTQ